MATPGAIEMLAQRAELLGFHSVVISDHIVQPVTYDSKPPYTASGGFNGDPLEQLALMSFVAAKTQALRLITSVMILPHRNPVFTAKSLATIDVLSQGRVTVGVGVGWLREEFTALDAPDFDRRGAVSDEYLRIFKVLWTDAPASFEGEFYRFGPLWCLPQPVQKPHPPIWIGGHSRASLRRVARHGDGWHPNPAPPLGPAEMRTKLQELRRLTEAEGRDFGSLTIACKAPLNETTLTGGSSSIDGERRSFSGTREQILEDIASYESLGVSDLIFDFHAVTLEQGLERMERFAGWVRL